MMKRLYVAVLLLCALPAAAQDVAVAPPLNDLLEEVAQLRPQDLKADQSSFIGTGPAVVIFADAEDDPLLARQLAALAEEVESLAERDVVLLIDADPSEDGPLRQKLHPRGFRIVLLDLEGDVVRRRPSVTTARWLIRQIDEMSWAFRPVYEPFCGSGTTIIAAELTGRACHAVELDRAYVGVAVAAGTGRSQADGHAALRAVARQMDGATFEAGEGR